jgi:hypothetical protein
VFGGLNRLLSAILVAGAVTAAVLVGPAAAASCGNGSTSAVSVYKECQQNGGGGKTSTTSTTGTHSGSTATVHHVSSQTTKALNKAGKDKNALAALVKTSGARRLYASKAGSGSTPNAVGSAFDLTSGPTALLIVLAGTALLLVAGSGMRVWRGRRSV